MHRFVLVHLRTSDVTAARAFYAAVLGNAAFDIVQLHEQAVARGARPHWLGDVEVDNVEAAEAAFIARGATSLGPRWKNAVGLELAVLRDPGGAVVAVARPPVELRSGRTGVAWHHLNSANVESAIGDYSALFGWHFSPPIDVGPLVVHPFSWEPGGDLVGSISDIAGRPGVHAHWLFQFGVSALDPAVAAVRAGGGTVLDVITLPGGPRIAVCDDPQGAAFGLREEAVGD